MANIKSAKKRIIVSKTREERNKAIRSGVKTAVKKVYAAIEENDKEKAKAAQCYQRDRQGDQQGRISQELRIQKDFPSESCCEQDWLSQFIKKIL